MNTNRFKGTICVKKGLVFCLLFPILFTVLLSERTVVASNAQAFQAGAGPVIRGLTDNLADYPNSQVPRFQKLEITFQIDTAATNLQMPYDPAPPSGIQPGQGISVDALFSRDNWQTVYTQPAFYYQGYLDQVKSGEEWFYPSGVNSWKVRFSPDAVGNWQYKVRAQDASGMSETAVQSFIVSASTAKGPIRVSSRDPRYFEYENGGYFPSLGYNMNFADISWVNPVLDNQENFSKMGQDGIQVVRLWLSQWSIFGSSWNPWQSIDPNLHGQYMPYTGLTFDQSFGTSDVSMEVDAGYNPCMFLGWLQAAPAVKQDTNYRVQIRYKTAGLTGPASPGQPHGLVAKLGGWLWDGAPGTNCNDPGSGEILTPYQSQNTGSWQILQGSFNSGKDDFLPYFYLVMENASQGQAYIDHVWIEEDLGNGQYGPNILPKPWMAQHQYMDQRNSYAFDKVVALAEEDGVYLRPVILEKNDYIFNRIDYHGQSIPDDPRCYDSDPNNDPAECPGNNWFYGNWRTQTKTRWLQEAWWRYLQARWGYSASIHSWELLNEGDPYNGLHYTLADEFGKYMHQFKPDGHLVSTSFWHSFPRDEFWANPDYPNIDFADIHQYIPQSDPLYGDTAQATYALSVQYGAEQSGGAGKPVIRGETGLTDSGSEPPTDLLEGDTQGLWLHNFIWAGINPGGLIESYWYEEDHIYHQINGAYQFDFRPVYRTYYNFIKNIPLSNGHYQDAAASVSDPSLRVWGQKDLAHGRAHLWIANTEHTWRAVVNGTPVPRHSGDITLTGFQPGASYLLQWWDTYQPDPARQIIRTEAITTDSSGSLTFSVQDLTTDTAVQILGQGSIQQVYLPLQLSP